MPVDETEKLCCLVPRVCQGRCFKG